MVNKQRILEILDNPRLIDPVEVSGLKTTLLRYPFFQPLRAALTYYYKINDLPRYRKELSVTAAHTADRGWLHQWIQTDFPEPRKTQPDPVPVQPDNEETFETLEPDKSTKPQTTAETKEEPDVAPGKLSYIEWVHYLSKQNKPTGTVDNPRRKKMERIERFLATQPRIKPRKDASFQPPPEITESIRENASLMTETLARLYVKQKKYAKAIQAYEILMLKYPEKNRYFANRIDEIKKLSNE